MTTRAASREPWIRKMHSTPVCDRLPYCGSISPNDEHTKVFYWRLMFYVPQLQRDVLIWIDPALYKYSLQINSISAFMYHRVSRSVSYRYCLSYQAVYGNWKQGYRDPGRNIGLRLNTKSGISSTCLIQLTFVLIKLIRGK